MMPKALNPYLTYSFALHCVLFFVAIKVIHQPAPKRNPVYTIDFIGPSTIRSFKRTSSTRKRSKAKMKAKATAKAAAVAAPAVRRPLPPPSFTAGKALPRPPEPVPEAAAAAPASEPLPEEESPAAEAPAGEEGTPAGPSAEIATDLPNFPYPWYISQIRASLWKQWSEKMPSSGGECTVVFSLLRDGRLVDLRMEESSGDPAFDLAALSTVRDAAPYPPLPRGFSEHFLKIHVELVSR